MHRRTEPPFRADHVGSLLRPPALLAAREQFAAGTLDADGLRAAEDAAIKDVVAMQEEIGLQSATDGEFRRTSWHMDFIYQLGGVTKTDEQIRVRMVNAEGEGAFTSAGLAIHDKVRLREPIFADAFTYLSEQVTTATPKLTIPSPSMVHYRGGTAAIDRSVYPDIEEFWSDLSAAYAAEITALGELADRPEGMRVTTHMCRGNFRSSWAAEGGYDFVAEALFGELDVDGFFCEFDDERSGGFAPLRFVPPGKQVVLGLVTTKTGKLENADDLKRRIDEAAKYVPLDQLCLSPQCGFSSTVEGNALTVEEQIAKLRLIVDVAQDVWG
jgi:5-methyltetrahydropteroyltriglutamate--homocysteine methyltransferase